MNSEGNCYIARQLDNLYNLTDLAWPKNDKQAEKFEFSK